MSLYCDPVVIQTGLPPPQTPITTFKFYMFSSFGVATCQQTYILLVKWINFVKRNTWTYGIYMASTLWLIHFGLYEIKYFSVPHVAGILHRQLNHCWEWHGLLSQDHRSATWTSIRAWAWRQILRKHEWNSGRSCMNHTIGLSNRQTCTCCPHPAAWCLSRSKLLKLLAIYGIRKNDGCLSASDLDSRQAT